ncbi:hypothetical protein NZK35_02000 [Stieleria sp. ICT_E10.1]|uniref:hypothetical protein n=1 Tax=Stieleria sedimenti TaxID=2976331 RepID=UPI00217FE254|nr:hypothetical protein [Stieleria sedimenti]MCS7465439.1 hypothetical protein [Stieleria sedimenti]
MIRLSGFRKSRQRRILLASAVHRRTVFRTRHGLGVQPNAAAGGLISSSCDPNIAIEMAEKERAEKWESRETTATRRCNARSNVSGVTASAEAALKILFPLKTAFSLVELSGGCNS